MIKRDISTIRTSNAKGSYRKRDAFDGMNAVLSNGMYGEILVLYGLRRTGKTVLMEQLVSESNEKCAFYEVEDKDSMEDVERALFTEQENGTTLVCLDEITKAKDFITSSSVLPDIFAKEGMKIVVAGTDSLGFQFADIGELFDRTKRIRTTHIPFAEHSRVLNTDDIDDYIMFGGLMRKGADERVITDYSSACKYLDSAVVENISNSIKADKHDNCVKNLSIQELRAIIEKMVEIYSGSFDRTEMQDELKKASVNYPISKLEDKDIIKYLTLEKKNITKGFAKVINADININTTITDDMVDALEHYLIEMDVLSALVRARETIERTSLAALGDFLYLALGLKRGEVAVDRADADPLVRKVA